MTARDCVSLQIFLLKFFGFVYEFRGADAKGHTNICSRTLDLVSIVLIFGGWFIVGLQAGVSTTKLFQSENTDSADHRANLLLDLIFNLPFLFVVMRGVICITIFLFKRKQFSKLINDTVHITAYVFGNNPNVQKHFRKWKRLGIILTIYTIVVCVTMDAIGWAGSAKAYHWTWTSGNIYYPLPLEMPPWLGISIWEAFGNLPALLSIQMYIILITLSCILGQCIDEITQAIKKEANCYSSYDETEFSSTDKAVLIYGNNVQDRECRMEKIFHLHSQVTRLCQEINATFGLIFATYYCFGFMIFVGMAGNIVFNWKEVTSSVWFALTGFGTTITEGIYVGIFMIPLIGVYEKGMTINQNLCRYADAAITIMQRHEGQNLRTILHFFLIKSRDQHLVIEGLHIFYATRHLFVATFTIALSFLVVAHEILQRSPDVYPSVKFALNVNATSD